MATLTSRLLLNLQDGVTGPARRIQGALASISAASRGVGAQVSTLSSRVQRIQPQSGVGFTASVGAGAFLASELRFQEAMNRTQAIMSVSADAFAAHRDLVVEISKVYPATSAEIAAGASELAMSGMSFALVNDVLEGAVQGAMASGESIATVGQGVTDVIMGLGQTINAQSFARLNDVMAAAATSYNQTYTGFLAGFQKTAPLAKLLGVEVEQLGGMLGMLANAGFKAEKGGVALRSSMINLLAPTASGMAALTRYGIKLEDFRGAFNPEALVGDQGAFRLGSLLEGVGGAGIDLGLLNLDQLIASGGDPEALRAELQRRIVEASELSGVSIEGADVADVANQFFASAFDQFDGDALMRALAESGITRDVAAMKDLFKLRHAPAMIALLDTMAEIDPETNLRKFDAAFGVFIDRVPGAVTRFAEVLMQGLPGALRRLASAFDALLRTMAASGAIDDVVMVFEALRDGINWLSTTNPLLLRFATLSLLVLGALAPIGFALSGVVAGFSALAALGGVAASAMRFGVLASFVTAGAGGMSFLSVLQALGAAAATLGFSWVGAILAVVAGAVYLVGGLDKAKAAVVGLWDALSLVTSDPAAGLSALSAWGANLADGVMEGLAARFEGLRGSVADFLGGLFSGGAAGFQPIRYDARAQAPRLIYASGAGRAVGGGEGGSVAAIFDRAGQQATTYRVLAEMQAERGAAAMGERFARGWGVIRDAGVQAVGHFGTAIDALYEIGVGVFSALESVINDVVYAVGRAIYHVRDLATTAYELFMGLLYFVGATLQLVGSLLMVIGNFGLIFYEVGALVWNTIGAIFNVFFRLQDVISAVALTVYELGRTVVMALGALVGLVSFDELSAAVGRLGAAFGGVGSAIYAVFAAVAGIFTTIYDGVVAILTQIGAFAVSLRDFGFAAWQFLHAVGTLFSAVFDFLRAVGEFLYSIGGVFVWLYQKIREFEQWIAPVVNGTKGILDLIEESFLSFDLSDAGRRMIESLIAGMRSMISGVSTVASDAYNAVMNSLGLGSSEPAAAAAAPPDKPSPIVAEAADIAGRVAARMADHEIALARTRDVGPSNAAPLAPPKMGDILVPITIYGATASPAEIGAEVGASVGRAVRDSYVDSTGL